ncbi:MAG: FGGY family carbohydrate kinase, partial [Micropruina sp.]|uniref:FGGY family carbohydrate kinase n=1 Tax=Micropruina sp. TaxID=2737536 RepID=UPI0039E4832A
MTAAVGIDIGTSNTKVVRVSDGVGEVVLSRPTPAGLDDLLALVVAGLRAATDAGPVAAVGIASMAESGYPLDADGRALTPLLSWRDARDDAEIRALAGRLGADALFAATGVRPGPKPSLAVWLWLRSRHPDTFAAMRRWAGVADAVHLALTGELRTDHTLAGRTLGYRLPAAGDPLAGCFDAALLAEAGLEPQQLPRVSLPGDPPAGVLPGTGTGLRTGTPVLVAGHDHQVAAWASGVRAVGQIADSVGTAEAMLHLVDGVPDRPAVRAQGMSVVRTVDGVTEALLAGTGSAGGLLQWLADRHTGGDVTLLLAGTEPSEPGLRGALAGPGRLLPYPAGRQCP